MMRGRAKSERERGSVAVLVLWGVAIIFAILAAASYTMRGETLIVRNELAASRARAAAEAGTQLGLAHLLARRARGATVFDGHPEPWQDGSTRIVVSIEDEAGKIDLNVAPPDLIAGLFTALGEPDAEAALIACRIAARRGSPGVDCADETPPPRGHVFAAPEEIAGLPGVGDRLFEAAVDDITVATGSSAIDPTVASRTVLLALPGATPELVDAWLAGRAAARELDPAGSGFGALPDAPDLAVSPLRDFTVSAVATTADGARARADLEVRLTGNERRPYVVLAFRTPPPNPAKLATGRRAP